MRAVLAGGGTGGHVLPLLALAEALQKSGLCESMLFLGADGLESSLVTQRGYSLIQLPVGRVRGLALHRQVKGVAGLAAAVPLAAWHLRRAKAQVVVGSGGYASAPAVTAAAFLGIPAILLEQNTIPGSTNRGLAKMAKVVCTSFAMSSGYFPASKVVVTGNPVREVFLKVRQERQSAPRDVFRVLVLGGSQGAQFLNKHVAPLLAQCARSSSGAMEIVHQCGKNREGEVGQAYEGLAGVTVRGYIDDMDAELRAASLVVGRAGATSLAELAVVGLPSILIPFPHATDGHQEVNARFYERRGAAKVFIQESFKAEEFVAAVQSLRGDPNKLRAMERASLASGIPDATESWRSWRV